MAPDETTSDVVGEVITCKGPPACPFTDDDAVRNMDDGCPLCRRVLIHADGSETEYRVPVN